MWGENVCFCLLLVYYLLRLICFARRANHFSLFGLGFVTLVAVILVIGEFKNVYFGLVWLHPNLF